MISQRELIWRKAKSGVKLAVSGTLAFGAIGLWTGNDKFFEEFLSPLLAHVDPELSHQAAVYLVRWHIQRRGLTEDPPNLRTKVGPLEFSNPIGIAAGFDKNAECMSGLKRGGYGWVEIGSVTPIPQLGNPKPRVFRLTQDSAIINRYGFNNDGHEAVYGRVKKFKDENPRYVVGVNLGANKESLDRISDYCKGISKFSDCADYFVINVSSPNTPNLRDLQKSESLAELLKQVMTTRDSQVKRVPVFLKVAPDISDADIKSICKTVTTNKDAKVDGLIISNTTVSRPDSLVSCSENVSREVGGLSGRPLERVSTLLIAKFYQELKGLVPIIGVGGVWDGKDVFAKIEAGASAVQIYSVVAFKGLGVLNGMKKELAQILENKGFKSVTEAVGTRHQLAPSQLSSSSQNYEQKHKNLSANMAL